MLIEYYKNFKLNLLKSYSKLTSLIHKYYNIEIIATREIDMFFLYLNMSYLLLCKHIGVSFHQNSRKKDTTF